ncbi:unnamed protein product [Paramecium sonneborni]|uniref:Transmembrane protein n=1 Tax=Paramecium sonneborni TaxID=65129 RepID=A0A8S1PIN5_9CILI|nr:unnamed protein product [Paramecium sonneborni]
MQKFNGIRSLVNLSKFRASDHHIKASHHQPNRPDLMTSVDIDKYRVFINKHPEVRERFFATYTWLPKITPLYNSTISKYIATSFSSVQAEAVSDVYFPPKLHENGINIYTSYRFGKTFRYGRSLEIVGGIFFLTTKYPLYYALVALFGYTAGFNAYFYELTRRTVIRMDLLPHTHQIAVQKIGAFGQVITKLHQISDLEHVNFSEQETKENYFWNLNYHKLDRNLIFKDKSTGEFLTFDSEGWWDRQALEHELLN